MCRGKTFLFTAVILIMASVANAGMVLTVNALDTSMPVEVKADDDIVIAVSGQTDAQKQSYSVICEMGGKLEPLPEPNTLAQKPKEGDYLFTFEDEELGLAIVNLTVGDVLDYQLILFKVPDANTVIFGIDSDAIEIPEPEPEPEPKTFLPLPEQTIVPYAQRMEQEKAQSLKFCPTGVGLISITGTLPAKESKGRELLFDGGQDGMMGGRGVIDVTSDITSNMVWTSDNTYHVLVDISVQALLVIEPNTTVIFAPDKSMSVNNGGTLISVGTPDNPIIYTSDSGTPDYDDYYCPMYIEETASANTKIMYSYVEYAYTGLVVLNNELETDIQNNYFYNNVYGIVEFGKKHTNIRNNLLVASYYSGIEVFLGNSTGEGSADSSILIENNTCDYYQDNGIMVHGVEDVNEAGLAFLSNNIVSGSCQYGIALVDYYMYAMVTNIGYFDNENNKNWAFEEENPAFENVLPYEMGTGVLPVCYLRQDCNFVNTGSFLIEQTPFIGQTTDVNEFPDSNYIDIGFHYTNWQFSNAGDSPSADLDGSLAVDFNDFAIFANYWQKSTSSDADLDRSGFVDYNDLSIFTNQWLQVADPNIEIHISGDSNDGYVDVGVNGFTSNTQQVFLFVDGQYVDEILWFREGEPLELDISALSPGIHQLKAVSIDTFGHVTCSNLKEDVFNCFINYCFCVDAYDSNEPHHFCAYYSGQNDITVKVYDEDDNIVWSQTYMAQNLKGFIPPEVTVREDLNLIIFESPSKGGEFIAKPLALFFNPKKVPQNIRALLVLPYRLVNLFNDVEGVVKQAFKTQGVPYYKLKVSNATFKNFAWFARNRNIEYLYYAGHGNYGVDPKTGEHYFGEDIYRTEIGLSNGKAVSAKYSNFPAGSAPPWCEPLRGTLERTRYSVYNLGFPPEQLKFVQFDCCFSGRLRLTSNNQLVESSPGQQGLLQIPESDMSWALRMTGGIDGQFCQGWWKEAGVMWGQTIYEIFSVSEWTKLKEGENLYQAVYDTFNNPNVHIDAVKDFRMYGMGDITAVKIE